MAIENQTDDPVVIFVAKLIQAIDLHAPDRDDDDCIDLAEQIIEYIKSQE